MIHFWGPCPQTPALRQRAGLQGVQAVAARRPIFLQPTVLSSFRRAKAWSPEKGLDPAFAALRPSESLV